MKCRTTVTTWLVVMRAASDCPADRLRPFRLNLRLATSVPMPLIRLCWTNVCYRVGSNFRYKEWSVCVFDLCNPLPLVTTPLVSVVTSLLASLPPKLPFFISQILDSFYHHMLFLLVRIIYIFKYCQVIVLVV